MRFIALVAVLCLIGVAAHAQTPTLVDFATVSMSAPGVPRAVTDTLCVSDGRDLVCDRGAYLLPGGLISTTNVSVTALTVNGVNVIGGGAATVSGTSTPIMFLANKTSDQTTTAGAHSKITFDVLSYDTNNNYSTASSRFTPTVSGYYLFFASLDCSTNPANTCSVHITKNGVSSSGGNQGPSGNGYLGGNVMTLYYMNGSNDYVEVTANTNSAIIRGISSQSYFGGVLQSGGFPVSTSMALGDRITSTSAGVVAMAGGTISFTTGGTSGTAYLDTVGRFVGAGVSTTGAISAASIYAGASLQLASPTAVTACNSTAAGTIRYNSPTTTLELCTGSGWQPMGVGIPAGTISAFASTTCPTGWSEYTAARGRFLRGIDNGAGNDPSGTRAPGTVQDDLFKSHGHNVGRGIPGSGSGDGFAANINYVDNLPQTTSTGGAETRPKNVAVTFCQFNGTSNGWNNPLSGGSTFAAGSTGQLQYNTANSFDASAGLTWTNASSLLGVAGTVSTTSITVGGLTLQQIMASATTAQGDRITSGTSAMVVNSATGIVSITQLGSVASYVHPSLGYVGPGVSTTGLVSTTGVYLAGTGNQCVTAADEGKMFRNSTTRKLQLCALRN